MKKQDGIFQSGKYLKLIRRDGWEYIKRVNCSGAAIVVAKTDDDKILLVEQFRVPVQRRTIGFPAGLVGDERGRRGESFASAAKRELLEETGYRARKVTQFFEGPVSAGMCSDMMKIFHATGLTKVAKGGGVDDLEQIKVHEVPFHGIDKWLLSQQKKGLLVGSNVFAGLYFLEHWVK